jgi:sugar lactone lactonase YvrE
LGFHLEKLYNPKGIDIDDDGSVYIADVSNHRIVRRAPNTTNGELAAGGKNAGNRIDQLNGPLDVVIDKKKNSLIICDQRNRRVMRWSLRNPTEQQIIISNINCNGLAIDSNGAVYVSDFDQSAVKRWREEESNGAIVAGGNGKGGRLNQLNYPTYLFVDQDYSVYVSDTNNNRVMKWMKDAKEGIIVAGGNGQGHNVAQLFLPRGLIVDRLSNVYVADCMNNRVVCWSKGSQEVRIVVGGYGEGHNSHTLTDPEDISFDRQGNLYVVDYGNHRVQKFDVED